MGSDRKSEEKKSRKRSPSSSSEDGGRGKRQRPVEDEDKKSRRSDKRDKSKDKKKSHKHSKHRSDKEKKTKDKHKSKHHKGDRLSKIWEQGELQHSFHGQLLVMLKYRNQKTIYLQVARSSFSMQFLKIDFQELSNDDYFLKNNEFSTWLKEEKDVFFSDLSSESARQLFADFVKVWNKQKLESKYYEGIASGPRCAHAWKIKG